MNKTKFLSLVLLPAFAVAQAYPDLNGKVVFGYQGWFSCPGGAGWGTNWTHWSNGAPTGTNMYVDFYPDLTEFPTNQLCRTNLTIQGQTAYLFSPHTAPVVDRHFQWMRTYGLDGVFLQRFLADIPGKRANGDTVLKNVRRAANTHGRGFAIEYDVSGVAANNILTQIQNDWMYLVDQMQITTQPSYYRYKGMPVVAVWGFGLNDGNHPATPAITQSIIQWFHRGAAPQYRASFVGGVASWWRTRTNDAFTDPAWNAVYDSMDIVQPWNVGRYNSIATADNWYNINIIPDMARTQGLGHGYQPVIFPGFSWYNLQGGASPVNQIPRLSGRFVWQQAINAKRAGSPMLKIAMYDEVNEGTAMFKCAPRRRNAPDQGTWVAFDADGDTTLPSDWYLRMGGVITQMFKGEIPITANIPIRPGDAWVGVEAGAPQPGIPRLTISRVDGGILFAGTEPGVEIRITDLQGRHVKSLRPDSESLFWNGLGADGHTLPKGVYYARPAGRSGNRFVMHPD